LVEMMIRTFDAFIIEEGTMDRSRVYGKLGTDDSDEIVFLNNFTY